MKKMEKRLFFGQADDWKTCIIKKLKISDNKVILDIRKGLSGAIMMPAIDSCETGFAWDRIMIDAYLPEGSSVMVYAYASDNPDSPAMKDVEQVMKDRTSTDDSLYQMVHSRFGHSVSRSCDFILHNKGRYLWLFIWLRSGGNQNPYISRVVYRMEGDHMIDYLPALYHDDDITRRFLSVFNSIYTDMDRQIDAIPSAFDYESNSESMLRFMAGWLGIEDGNIPVHKLRKYVSRVLHDYETMYTPAGIARNIYRLTGKEPVILEYADVDPNAENCPNPEQYRKLFGDDPFKFFVLLDNDTFKSREEMDRFIEKMEDLIPAGTSMELIMLHENMELGDRAVLGEDTVLGDDSDDEYKQKAAIIAEILKGGSHK